jgi:group II intron reverse transcriptase/maturase
MKRANKAGGKTVAESVERRAGTKGNADQAGTPRAQDRTLSEQGLKRIRQAARDRKGERFVALLHHINLESLREAFYGLRRDAAPGVDGVTWTDYEVDLQANLERLNDRVHRGAYRAQPSRRKFIGKEDGTQRPLGIASVEDKILQSAVVRVLNAIYEEDFIGFSYGFRPGRSQHDALDALIVGIKSKAVNWILDLDIRSFFDSVSHEWLIKFLEHRIADPRVLQLIRNWLQAGVLEGEVIWPGEAGTPQGATISPLLANVYLHYAVDLWAQRWRNRHARGDVIIVRYADDSVLGFQHHDEAERFLEDLRARLEGFRLTLHPQKTRLIEFGRHAAAERQRRGLGKPDTFNFLGFTLMCGTSRRGHFMLLRHTRRDRLRNKLRELKDELRRRMHESIPEQGKWLEQVVRGYFEYHAVPTNFRALVSFRENIRELWQRVLNRRSQKGRMTLERMHRLADAYLPRPRIIHPWPEARFAVNHPR